MKSPFPTGPLTQHDPLCGRIQEILTLCEAAGDAAPTVLYGPSLLGKTTVLDRVQSLLAQQGAVAIKLSLGGSATPGTCPGVSLQESSPQQPVKTLRRPFPASPSSPSSPLSRGRSE